MSVSRLREIIAGVKWAFRFDNPFEVLCTRHVFRRKRSVMVEHGGMQMLIDSQSSDAMAVTEVLLDAMYDQAIKSASTATGDFRYLNLGANIGAFDVRVFQLLRARHHSIIGTAVEMNPATCARLLLNLELNRMFSVRAVNAAAWDEPGTVFLSVEDRDTGQRCAVGGDTRGHPVPLMPWRAMFDIASAGGHARFAEDRHRGRGGKGGSANHGRRRPQNAAPGDRNPRARYSPAGRQSSAQRRFRAGERNPRPR